MAKCVFNPGVVNKYCVGSLNKKIDIKSRSLDVPSAGSFDYDLTFSAIKTVWSNVKTVTGVTMFDSVNVERVVTHEFIIRYYDGLTIQHWIEYSGNNYDIIDIVNIGEESQYYKIRADIRGSSTVPVNKA